VLPSSEKNNEADKTSDPIQSNPWMNENPYPTLAKPTVENYSRANKSNIFPTVGGA